VLSTFVIGLRTTFSYTVVLLLTGRLCVWFQFRIVLLGIDEKVLVGNSYLGMLVRKIDYVSVDMVS